jgi:alanyl-tRNA synthetase
VLSQTPFYAEGGGQVGDTGILIHETSKETIQIVDTKKENGLIIHFSDEIPSHLEGVFFAKVAEDRRRDIQSNHSATHLLHAALKQVLGEHVNQKGSLVSEEVLRFDFSHFAKVSDEELRRVEQVVNAKIRENLALDERRNVPYNDAIDMGVTALFGEKYGDFVRVIIFDENFSKELCGGTHVQYTGNIGFFKILSEGAVAAGVRRIEAITGRRAEEIIDRQDELINELKNLLKHPKDLSAAITGLLQENSKLKKEVEKSLAEKAQQLRQVLVEKAIDINGVRFIGEQVELPNADAVKSLAFAVKKAMDSNLFLVLATDFDGKPNLTVMLSDDLVNRGLDAGKIVRELAKEIKGGGGGQPFYATAGGKDSSGLTVALEKAKSFVG